MQCPLLLRLLCPRIVARLAVPAPFARIYRTAMYHSRTKHQWARDDPAFVVVLLYLLLVAVVAWSLAFGEFSLVGTLQLALYVVCVDFLARQHVTVLSTQWASLVSPCEHVLHRRSVRC